MNNNTYATLPETSTRHEWLLQRNEGIGSSDASAIAGLSDWESPYSLWMIKTGQAPLDPPVDEATQRLREWGNRLEPVILDATADQLGIGITKPTAGLVNCETPWLRANLDGITDDGRICEFKTAHFSQAHKWDGQIADHAEIQVHHAGLVTGIKQAVVAVLIGGSDLRVFEIDLNPNISEMLFDMEQEFWQHVTNRTEPDVDGHARTLQALTAEWQHRTPAKEVAADDAESIWQAWLDADKRKKAAELDINRAKSQLARLMDGHDEITTGDRTWAKTRRGQLSLRNLAAAEPDLVEKYTTKPTFDLDAFKDDHPDIYRKHQAVSIIPTKPKEEV